MTDLIVQVDPVLLSPNLLPGYLEELIVWERSPVRAKSLRLSFSESSGQRWVFGNGDHAQQERGMFLWRITGMANSRDGYIRVAVSKPLFAHLYPREASLPERFPPLSTRIANFSKADLLLELGKGFDASQKYARYPYVRDEIVLSQILAKGQLTDAEIQQVVVGQFDQAAFFSAVNDRLLALLLAAQKRGLLSQYLPALERLFLTARPQGGLHWVAAERMFGFMGRNGIDASGTALALVERNQFVRPSLMHLKAHGRSEEVLKRLAAARVGPEFTKDKEDAIDRIGSRLKSLGKP